MTNDTAAGAPPAFIEVTPDVAEELMNSIRDRKEDIAKTFPVLVDACPTNMRLAVTAFVIDAIVQNALNEGSFRKLIYSRMGFGPDAYLPLFLAGGMDITNELVLPPAVTAWDQTPGMKAIHAAFQPLPVGPERSALAAAWNRLESLEQAVAGHEAARNAWRREITEIAESEARLRAALQAQHSWHLGQTDAVDHGIVPAEAYAESALCDQTLAALGAASPPPDQPQSEVPA